MDRTPSLDRSLDPSRCLDATSFIDCHSRAIRERSERIVGDADARGRAIRLFQYVRDEVSYEFRAKLGRHEYEASRVLVEGKGFCVQKAVLLCALLRAADVPAAIVLCDMRDHSLPKRIVEAMRTDTLFHHGLNAIFVDGRWLLADASLSPDVVTRKRYRRTEFTADGDAIFPSTTLDDHPHAEILRYHGMYADLPFEQTTAAFLRAYGDADLVTLGEMGFRF